MSLEEDARMARVNAQGAIERIEDARFALICRLNELEATMTYLIKGAVLYEAVKLVSKDMHTASNRPCSTCQTVTNAIGEPFGCVAFAQRRTKT